MKKKGRKAFWRNIKFKYKLTVINENTLEEVIGIHVSKLNGFSVLLAACTVIFLLAAIIIVFTPLRNYLPGYMNSEVRSQVVTNALKADSLVEALERQNRYIMNIQDIFSGKVNVDTVQSIDSLTTIRTEELMNRSTSAYVGLVGNLSVAMLFSSMILTISQTLAQRPVLYGKYRYDWLTTFINNGPRRNFAS